MKRRGTRCAGYKYKVEEKVKTKEGHVWAKRAEGEELGEFYLEDKKGAIPVDSKGADLNIETNFKAIETNFKKLPEEAQEFLKKGNVKSIEWNEESPKGY